ncbi:hypothetical protein NELLIE_31 [Arthrobacter phage Nellie]|uniref:Uncharacterized protein n=4 Tax=Jasminevirus adat TaxID=2560299 RepID=A0A249XN70_9CAUD|nr:hypothetical protein FDI47_gp31 [Arthrobacter phage Adat]ASZ72603.1 hypothetical protein ADAT_31 [Arthrobacter phage Adat]ASZ73185.1 hypothetical protein GURGLEFERB_31 [Arthrobacter phage GurgleFerb]ASZ73749.1 hypothetical protein NELLIE_31 [Arthrobacter phage Nellie]AXH43719.1 hypothetical protein SEA_BRAD_31 [Arthrobacter phage Brad]
MMGNIYTNPEDYRIWQDVSVHMKDIKDGKPTSGKFNVYNVRLNLRLAGFHTQLEAETFIQNRCSPVSVPDRVYPDICRCGGGGPAWNYAKVKDLIFEQCPKCSNPMRHDVMVELNRPFLENFSLDDFLNL